MYVDVSFKPHTDRFLGKFTKFLRAIVSFVMSVCPGGKTRFLLDGFSLNLILQNFSKVYRENSSSIKISQEQRVLYVNTYARV